MSRRRSNFASLVSLVLVAFAASAVPRDAWYVHEHAGDGVGHVHLHARPNDRHARDADEAWWQELLADSVAHRHAHDGAHEHAHPHSHAAAPDDASAEGGENPGAHEAEPRVARRLDGAATTQTAAAQAHPRPSTRGRSSTADADERRLVAASLHPAAHAHWQAPFQLAESPDAATLPQQRLVVRAAASPAPSPRAARALALRARGPPIVSA